MDALGYEKKSPVRTTTPDNIKYETKAVSKVNDGDKNSKLWKPVLKDNDPY